MEKQRCLGRHCSDKAMGFFGNGKNKFHLELRCVGFCVADTKLCGKCHEMSSDFSLTKQQKGAPKKQHPQLLHGLMDEDIPSESHIFEGIWYQSKVALYGLPSEAEMGKGKQAKIEAFLIRKDPVDQLTESVKTMHVAVVKPVKQKAKRKLQEEKEEEKEGQEEEEKEGQEEKEKQPQKKKRTAKKTVAPSSPTNQVITPFLTNTKAKAKAYESDEPTRRDVEVVRIAVQRFEHKGVKYFLDPRKNKLYSMGADMFPAKYHGRWDPESETITTDFPDSDYEN